MTNVEFRDGQWGKTRNKTIGGEVVRLDREVLTDITGVETGIGLRSSYVFYVFQMYEHNLKNQFVHFTFLAIDIPASFAFPVSTYIHFVPTTLICFPE